MISNYLEKIISEVKINLKMNEKDVRNHLKLGK